MGRSNRVRVRPNNSVDTRAPPNDTMNEEDALIAAAPKKRTFRKFSYRGVDLDQLLDLKTDALVDLFRARIRRRFKRGLTRKAKKEATSGEKPETVRTHLRNMVIVPEMIGSVVGVYNGKVFNTVEIKPEMVGTYLGEYSITYRPVSHGRSGLAGGKFIPLK